MADDIKFTYNDETKTLIIKDNGHVKVFKIDDNRYSYLFKSVLRAIDKLDGDEPTPPTEVGATLYPVVYSSGMFGLTPIDITNYLTEGTYQGTSEGDVYTIIINGVTYNNVVATRYSIDESDPNSSVIYLGNISAYIKESEMGLSILQMGLELPKDNGLPFFFGLNPEDPTDPNITFAFNSESTDQVITLIKSGNSCTITLDNSALANFDTQIYITDYTRDEVIEKYNVSEGKTQLMNINGTDYECIWSQDPHDQDIIELRASISDNKFVDCILDSRNNVNACYFISNEGTPKKVVYLVPSN